MVVQRRGLATRVAVGDGDEGGAIGGWLGEWLREGEEGKWRRRNGWEKKKKWRWISKGLGNRRDNIYLKSLEIFRIFQKFK